MVAIAPSILAADFAHLADEVVRVAEAGARRCHGRALISLLHDILPDLDMVLLMSVNPGFGGQAFIPGTIDKIRALKHELEARQLSVPIAVDGGIKPENTRLVCEAGGRYSCRRHGDSRPIRLRCGDPGLERRMTLYMRENMRCKESILGSRHPIHDGNSIFFQMLDRMPAMMPAGLSGRLGLETRRGRSGRRMNGCG